MIKDRFRGYLPIIVDVETAGFNSQTDALLEAAAVIIDMDEEGLLYAKEPALQYGFNVANNK